MPTNPGEHEVLLDALVDVIGVRARLAAASGRRRRACASASPASSSLTSRICGAPGVGQRPGVLAHQLTRAAPEQHVRRALGEDEQALLPLRVAYESCSSASARRRTAPPPTRSKRASSASVLQAGLARRDDERAFGRVALHRPAAVALLQDGVVGAVADRERALQLGAQRAVDHSRLSSASLLPDRGSLAFRRVAGAAQAHPPARRDDHAHGHLVLRQACRSCRRR